MNGKVSRNIFCIQAQLKSLLEEAGGEDVLSLLDELAELNGSEQKIVLKVMRRLIQDLLSSDERLTTEGDLALKRFEDSLYHELVEEMKQAVLSIPDSNGSVVARKLELVRDEEQEPRQVIDLAEARKSRKIESDTSIN